MKTFPASASNFELHPSSVPAARHLAPLIKRIGKIDFDFHVNSAATNQGQMVSNFDQALETALSVAGAQSSPPDFPSMLRSTGIRQELDFSISYGGKTIAVEVEKANREKILRDVLKSHQYLAAGADFALIVLPVNYAHSGGVWDLFDFGKRLYDQCRTFGFGKEELLDRIVLLGFTQYCAETNAKICRATRISMRKAASEYFASLVR